MFAAEVVPTLMMPRRNEITSGVVKVDLVSMPVMTATQGRKREEVISEGAPSRGHLEICYNQQLQKKLS